MIKNYLKVALRNLRNNKAFASLNIVGLAIGMATAIIIGLWVFDELTYDHYNPNHEKLAKIMLSQNDKGDIYIGPTIAMPLGIRNGSENIRSSLRKLPSVSFHDLHILGSGDKKISGNGILCTEIFSVHVRTDFSEWKYSNTE